MPKKNGIRHSNKVHKCVPKWCHKCIKPITTHKIHCPYCKVRFYIKTPKIDDIKNKWHAASPSGQRAGTIDEVCQMVRHDISKQRGQATATIWFDKEPIASVRWMAADGRTVISYNEKHPSWNHLNERLTLALKESGLVTA